MLKNCSIFFFSKNVFFAKFVQRKRQKFLVTFKGMGCAVVTSRCFFEKSTLELNGKISSAFQNNALVSIWKSISVTDFVYFRDFFWSLSVSHGKKLSVYLPKRRKFLENRAFPPKWWKINKWTWLFQILEICVFWRFFLVPKFSIMNFDIRLRKMILHQNSHIFTNFSRKN